MFPHSCVSVTFSFILQTIVESSGGSVEMGTFGGDASVAPTPPVATVATKKPRGKGTTNKTTAKGKLTPQCPHLMDFMAQGGTNIFNPLARCCIAASFPGNAPKSKMGATLVRGTSQTFPPLNPCPPPLSSRNRK